MGRIAAEDMAVHAPNRRTALIWHFYHNHFPPVPHPWLDVAERVIDRLNSGGDPTELIANPVRRDENGLPEWISLGRVAEGLHLETWIDPEGE